MSLQVLQGILTLARNSTAPRRLGGERMDIVKQEILLWTVIRRVSNAPVAYPSAADDNSE
jgi:hypothetical protein